MSDSEPTISDIESTDEPTIVVDDPDDYHRTKKIESIHRARKRVHDIRANNPAPAQSDQISAHKTALARAVADFGTELIPLIEDGMDTGTLDQDDLDAGHANVWEFVESDGHVIDHDNEEARFADKHESMAVYRQLDRILRKLGLGLDLEKDRGPAEI
jgi:hypothetical protein